MTEYHPGLDGVIATESSISDIDGGKGILSYRGYSIEDLAQNSTFEETSYLLLTGELPKKDELNRFSDILAKAMVLPPELIALLKAYPKNSDSMFVLQSVVATENIMGSNFGDPEDPLLLSIRSGARQSMPGMMETVLNVGLTSKTIPGLISKTGNARFVYDAYRRLIMMYADVVMEKAAGVEPENSKGIRHKLESLIEDHKRIKQYSNDTDLSGDDWKELSEMFKDEIERTLGSKFPDDPMEQLWGGIKAVFASWNGERAINYRRCW